MQGRRRGRSAGERLGGEDGEPHTPAQISRSARSRPGAPESRLRCSLRPHSWSGHRTVALRPCCSRTCAAPRPPRRLSGTRGGWGAGPLTSCGGRQAASLSTPLPGSHCRWEVYPAVGFRLWRREVPKCQSSPRGLTPFVHELRAPRLLGTVAPPQNRRALLDSPSGGGKDLPLRSVLFRLPCQPRSQKG